MHFGGPRGGAPLKISNFGTPPPKLALCTGYVLPEIRLFYDPSGIRLFYDPSEGPLSNFRARGVSNSFKRLIATRIQKKAPRFQRSVAKKIQNSFSLSL